MEPLQILPLLVDGLSGPSVDINYVRYLSEIYNNSECNYQRYMRVWSLLWAYPVVASSNIDFAFSLVTFLSSTCVRTALSISTSRCTLGAFVNCSISLLMKT